MNIFIFDSDIQRNVQYHCDKHTVKMILEYAQLLCTAINETGGWSPYRSTHKNHPCAKWVRESLSNWEYLRNLGLALGDEYEHRYGKKHKSKAVIKCLDSPIIADIGLTPFAQAMPDEYKNPDPVIAYRNYFKGEKSHIAEWKSRPVPKWYLDKP